MGRLRVTMTVEYDLNPKDYNVTTMEEAAAEERQALQNDLLGTLAWLDGDESITVEVVD